MQLKCPLKLLWVFKRENQLLKQWPFGKFCWDCKDTSRSDKTFDAWDRIPRKFLQAWKDTTVLTLRVHCQRQPSKCGVSTCCNKRNFFTIMRRDNPSWNYLPANPLLAWPFSTNQQMWPRHCNSFSEIVSVINYQGNSCVFTSKHRDCFVLF